MDQHIEKIIAVINDTAYSFSIEVLPDEDGTIYRATPDQHEETVEKIIPGFIEFDEKGNVLPEEMNETEKGKTLTAAVWRGIKEQIINDHVSFNAPLQ
jgi:hypothetical protein